MSAGTPEAVRNVALIGHGACGKTTLAECLLATAGAISRQGSVTDGNTVCDFDAQEKERQYSIDLACARLQHNDVTVHLVDAPGYREFLGQVYCSLTAVECAIVVVDADEGVRPNTRKAWEIASDMGVPCFVVINRCDRENADVDQALSQVQEQLDGKVVPLTLASGSGSAFSSVELTFGNAEGSDAAKSAAETFTETVVESDDDLMEQYLGGEEIAEDALQTQVRTAVLERAIFPALFTSGEKGVGVPELLDALVSFAPDATATLGRQLTAEGSEESQDLQSAADGPFLGFIFKILSDPYVGKLSYLRVFSGSLQQNGSIVNPRTGKSEKVGKLIQLQGNQHDGVEEATAGGIYAIPKLESLATFDVVSAEGRYEMALPKHPTPMFSRAVAPKSKADEKKFAEAIGKVLGEDILLRSERDQRTGELVVSGMSQLHLQILWDRLKSRFDVEVTTKEPKTPYLETITAKAEGGYRHKKQSGGAGEFAEVHLRVEPLERGEGIEFISSVFGGAISASYVGSAEKGIRALLTQGVMAACPIVDLKVDIFDGKEHPVDSKDIAFQKAGREAFKVAMENAKPVLLEPIVDLEVYFPVESMGDIQGDLNRRRGRVVGMDAVGAFQTLKAQVPLAELADYASTLGSLTGGQGTYGIEMSHYEVVPPNVQRQVCDAVKAEAAKDE